jgi:hypothetical protein
MKTLILGACILVIGIIMYLLYFNVVWTFFVLLIGGFAFFYGAFLTINKLEPNDKAKNT